MGLLAASAAAALGAAAAAASAGARSRPAVQFHTQRRGPGRQETEAAAAAAARGVCSPVLPPVETTPNMSHSFGHDSLDGTLGGYANKLRGAVFI